MLFVIGLTGLASSGKGEVSNYLVEKYGFPAIRMRTVGNGPDRPVADNSTPEGREKNRRTDIKVYPNTAG